MNRAEQLFHQLQSASAILALIGQSEDAHLDCKEWPSKDEDCQRVLAKAACGLTNAEGGVLIIGMRAKPTAKEQPDLIQSPQEVTDTSAVKSRVLDLIGQLVEPPIAGVEAHEFKHPENSKSGFVVVYIPASEGFPRRSRKDWKFYLRIGSGTFPMEYFQIADMFGKRPHNQT
jgi:predicted HTH transcriptional regulator